MCTVEMVSCSMICVLSSINIDTTVQTILRFCLSSFNGCYIGITDERDI
jgi:hypothetical protein